MKKKISLIFIVILGLALYSCSTMFSDEFVYLGHPKSLSEYHIYYDKTQNLYMFVDTKGCFYKSEESGTCFALDEDETKYFLDNVLPKMITAENKILKYKQKLLKYMKETNKKSIKKAVKINYEVRPVKQIDIDNHKEYHLVNQQYNLEANLVVIENDDDILVLYSVRIPEAMKRQKTPNKPFLLDPEYLKKIMNKDFIARAEKYHLNKKAAKKAKQEEFNNFLNNDIDI
ncbi:FTN_0109 family protein [Francisella salina]|uniref:FTN_0109 family protein n=1 Tax=Francisella salina TaxID=573569 RepID=UPI00059E506F|nr:hypothetical protein [Francisella salina]